jgi:subtilisin family serine protease
VPAPGDYPNKAFSLLDTPALDLALYEEVYVEFWFYAKFAETWSLLSPTDFGLVAIYHPGTGATSLLDSSQAFGLMVGLYTGDLTADPTTERGWRRALFRLPPALRMNGVKVRFVFRSNDSLTAEGLYIDEIRVVATTDVDTAPIGNDTYGARPYEMKNSGQIAGLGNGSNDMRLPAAWDLVSVSPAVVVAVIDAGVDLSHPDLNLVTGYEPNGAVGGGPRDPHGTAVAGNVGAIRNNSIGVIGTAPAVKIMPVFMGGSESENASAIDVAVAHGARVLTNSWGRSGAPNQTIEDAIIDALNAGRTVLFAAGNGPDRPPWTYDVIFPASLCGSTDVICVGASSPTDEHKAAASSDGSFLWGSSYVGAGPDVVAPSPWSYTTDIQGAGGYNPDPYLGYSLIDPTAPRSEDYTPLFGGTSSATPKVAGVAALILSANPALTPASVKRILRETADDIDAPGVDDKTGAGRVNAERAVRAAMATLGGLRTGLSLHAGVAIPTGVLNTTTDPGPTINLDFVYAITRQLGVDARLGYSRFIGSGGAPDREFMDLSLNAKYVPVLGSPWLFVNGGLGLYYLDWRDLHGAGNVGVGLGRRITPHIDLEATANYHRTFTASPNLGFVKAQVGAILSF